MRSAPEVVAFVHTFYDALKRGDVYAVSEFCSKEATEVIGTDPAEYWTGHPAITGAFKAQLEALGGLVFVPGDIQGYRDEDLGWFVDQPRAVVGDDELPVRLTGVVRREHGIWRLLQCHLSIGVDNVEALGQALPV